MPSLITTRLGTAKRPLLRQTLRAIKALHSADVLHRDLKPSKYALSSPSFCEVCRVLNPATSHPLLALLFPASY